MILRGERQLTLAYVRKPGETFQRVRRAPDGKAAPRPC